tara:strand:- start:2370 stop:3305 length:936 start_codon:yes stop_codon:yes gene_type:complete
MIKKIKIFILFFFLINSFSDNNLYGKISIKVKVDDEIITNIDIEKEAEYLKILNPNLNNLEKEKIYNLAKNSLINEIIKKKEITKFIDINQDNQFIENYLKDLYTRLNFSNENDFKKTLEVKNNYSIDEIKHKIKLELFWNELIYSKYNKQVKIDQNKLINKINNFNMKNQNEYFLSEIVFSKKKGKSLGELINQIKLSIDDIGFNNTANIYSISESSKFGGKIGWVNENSLSDLVSEKLNNINEGEFTEVIKVGNNYLILKIDKIKKTKLKIDKQKELEKLIQIEQNKQLNQFSRIYFDKSKINYSINEI